MRQDDDGSRWSAFRGQQSAVVEQCVEQKHEGPLRGRPKCLYLMVPAPGVEPGTY